MSLLPDTLARNLFRAGRRETAGERVFFRCFEAFVAGCFAWMSWVWGLHIQRLTEVVAPLGVAQYVDVSLLLQGAWPLTNAAAISVALAAGFFFSLRGAYAGALMLVHLQYVARFSLGKVQHGSVMLGMGLLGLALATLFFEQRREQRRFALGFTYFYVGLSYPLAAACKLIGTGVGWPSGYHLWLWVREKGIDGFANTGVLDFNAVQELALADYRVATAFLAAGLLTEMSAFLLWWRRFRVPVGVAVLGMHAGIYVVMDILFWANMVLVALLAFPWARWLDRVGLAGRQRVAGAAPPPGRAGSQRAKPQRTSARTAEA